MTTTAPRVAGSIGAPPWSRALHLTAGICLVLGGVLNGLPQFVLTVLTGDLSFADQIAWSAEHPVPHRLEQTALLVSSLVMLPGLLGLAHVCRFAAPGNPCDRPCSGGLTDPILAAMPASDRPPPGGGVRSSGLSGATVVASSRAGGGVGDAQLPAAP